MAIFYGAIWYLKYSQIQNRNDSFSFLIISLTISISISVINVILRILIKFFAHHEKRTSYTIQENLIVMRIGIVYFFSNAIIVLITYRTTASDWRLFRDNGVAFTIQVILLLSILFDGLYDLYHHEFLYKFFLRLWYRRKLSKKQIVFQMDLNKSHEGIEIDIAERYY